jgi:hypothetical protein
VEGGPCEGDRPSIFVAAARLDARSSILDSRFSMLDARFSMLDARFSMLDPLLDTRYSANPHSAMRMQ